MPCAHSLSSSSPRQTNVSIRFEIDSGESLELKKANMVCTQYEHPELPNDK
jgi:hypothetical protein